ncbi:glycosyltransferase family 4 protein [Sulfurovum sp. AR]|uniref:glycosyltransferase family 4 protein n=1 Tax=Sulfurovum sp. AR TaxID=1165841 RepID=UPI00025C47BF|nr:glycosyltransferase [Sulfurovum sp. AR]EIF51223.1 group 1 glycosyl transferase [Sulfurovum sp. AR]
MKKFVYISNLAVPTQVKFCEELNDFLDTEMWFYEHMNETRPSWWKIELCSKCKIMEKLLIKKNGKYFTFDVLKKLNNFNPDIVMLGGFSIPSNYIAYIWARFHKKRTIVFTEISRDRQGKLRPYNFIWKILSYLYKDADYIFTSNDDAAKQFKENFHFGDKVISTRYASDLDTHLKHPLRIKKEEYTFLFANRLINIYNPLLAIEIFYDIVQKMPKSKLLMNNQGILKEQCVEKIKSLGIEKNIEFLTDIKAWDELSSIYQRADILIFPAIFSNGNFTINEAMASGLGIVVSDEINGHGDTLKNDENCFICEVNKDRFVEKILMYIEKPELFSVHGKQNKSLMQPLSIRGTAKFYYDTFQLLGLI